MNVLIVGSGGREHAIAWKISSEPYPGAACSSLLETLARHAWASMCHYLPDDHAGIAAFCLEREIGLVMIGPEAPLAAGLADELRRHGLKVFGPSAAAAQIELSKAFAKSFMQRHGIPTARFGVFSDYECGAAQFELHRQRGGD